MLTDFDTYELSSTLEIDQLLTDLPIGLMKENLKYQIDNPLSTNVNYINIIMDKYEVLKEFYKDNPDESNNIRDLFMDIMMFILDNLSERFSLDIDVDKIDNVFVMTDMLYNYLILDYRNNLIDFIYCYIMENKKLLIDTYEKTNKKKDITTLFYKKKIKNKDDLVIFTNLSVIITDIKESEIDPLIFLEFTSKDSYEGKYVMNLFKQGTISGDFVVPYVDHIFDVNDIYDEVFVDIKLKLAEKLL